MNAAMKRWFRPVAYSLVLILAGLAIFGGKPRAAATPDVVRPVERTRVATRVRAAESPEAPAPMLAARSQQPMAADLFAAPASVAAMPAPATTVAEIPSPTRSAPPDLKVLGWMLADGKPVVFAQIGGEHFVLAPGQDADSPYRFDRLGGGLAVFTYLPNGTRREFAVGDPESSD